MCYISNNNWDPTLCFFAKCAENSGSITWMLFNFTYYTNEWRIYTVWFIARRICTCNWMHGRVICSVLEIVLLSCFYPHCLRGAGCRGEGIYEGSPVISNIWKSISISIFNWLCLQYHNSHDEVYMFSIGGQLSVLQIRRRSTINQGS